jgi:hypothetical protein
VEKVALEQVLSTYFTLHLSVPFQKYFIITFLYALLSPEGQMVEV